MAACRRQRLGRVTPIQKSKYYKFLNPYKFLKLLPPQNKDVTPKGV